MITRTHPHIPIRRESTYRLVAHILVNYQCRINAQKRLYSPRSVDLINCLISAQGATNRVSQLAAFETGSTPIHNDYDVFERADDIVMPVAIEFRVNFLRSGTAVSVIVALVVGLT